MSVDFPLKPGLSSPAFFASVPAAKPARRVAGAALFVSRCTRGFVAAVVAGLAACASPGFSFFCGENVRHE